MALEFTGMIPTGEVFQFQVSKKVPTAPPISFFFSIISTFPVGIPLEKQTAEEFSFYSMQTCHLKTLGSM